MCNTVHSQISPGDLTNAHSELEGISNCTKCHELGEEVKSSKCLDCHSEISELINSNRGYHSSNDVKSKECFDCHSEHHGRNFQIVRFDKASFDHKKAKFELLGRHSQIKCEECHNSKYITDEKIKQKKNTFLGLNPDCLSCHTDFHQQTLSPICLDCHDFNSFRPAPKFNHLKAEFQLTGAHENVKCISCHPKTKKEGKDFQQFTNLKFEKCLDCHKDPHSGKFGSNCESCHKTTSFKDILNLDRIDHNSTGFPLIGKHQNIECKSCHGNNLSRSIKHDLCIDCHNDYHKGDFKKGREIADCKECHNEFGFSPSLYTIEKHNQSNFVLIGSHLAIPCKKCHFIDNEWKFRVEGEKCIYCHENVHGNEISSPYLTDNNCENCHSSQSWSTVKFDHNRTEFILKGKHAEIDCRDCHIKETFSGKFVHLFKSVKTNCEFCHEDNHAGQFKKGEFSECAQCHTFKNWKPENFDHNNSRFKLEGAHVNVACVKCHTPFIENGKKYFKYKFEEIKCAVCHS